MTDYQKKNNLTISSVCPRAITTKLRESPNCNKSNAQNLSLQLLELLALSRKQLLRNGVSPNYYATIVHENDYTCVKAGSMTVAVDFRGMHLIIWKL